MRKIISFTSVTLVLLFFLAGNAAAVNIYFYQAKTTGDYTTDKEYSAFKDKLTENGYEINDLLVGLSRDSLDQVNPEPDIIVIPNLGSDLSAEETTALFEFVIKSGKGVFLCGATPSTNKLTIPLGMMASTDLLEDDVNSVRDSITGQMVTDKTTFYVELPANRPDPVISSLTRGVNTLDIFTAGGIYVFGDSKGVVFGGDAVNTPKALTFPKKSNPPLAAYIQLGTGWIFLLSDPDILANKNLDSARYRHDNLKFGVNIIDWLSQPATDPTASEDEIDNIIRSLRTETLDLNRTIAYQENEKSALNDKIITLTAEKDSLSERIDTLSKNSFMGFKYEVWAMGVLSLCFLLTVGVIIKKNKKVSKLEKGDMGYEFDEKEFGTGGADNSLKGDGKIKEEDIEERLKELQKGSQ
ncbi:MAG: hypothetical protein WAX07_08095 [Candidatus Altiarchaeia archaeon]